MGLLSVNDMLSAQRTHFFWTNTQVNLANDAVAGGPCILFRITITSGNTPPAAVIVNNAVTTGGGGTAVTVSVPVAESHVISFEPQGIHFDTNMSILIDAAANHVDVLYKVI